MKADKYRKQLQGMKAGPKHLFCKVHRQEILADMNEHGAEAPPGSLPNAGQRQG